MLLTGIKGLNCKTVVLILFFLCCYFLGFSQNDSTAGSFAITIEGHYGFVFAHRPSIISLQNRHLGGFMISVSKPSDGKKRWQHQYHLPQIGFKYGFFGLGNRERLGYGHICYPYIDLPLGSGKKSLLNLQLGWGLGYITKPYQRFENSKNMAIGSHLNAVIALGFNKDIQLTSRDILKTAIGITHMSNGSFATPNLGVNLSTVSLHYQHFFGNKKEIASYKPELFKRNYRKTIFIAGGIRQIYPVGGRTYIVGSLSGSVFRQYSERAAIGIGLDYFYDYSNTKKLNSDKEIIPVWTASRIGFAGGYEVIMTDFSIIIQTGVYLKNEISEEGAFYNRVGVRYQFTEKFFACINLKAHWGRADFGEWGIGYKFK